MEFVYWVLVDTDGKFYALRGTQFFNSNFSKAFLFSTLEEATKERDRRINEYKMQIFQVAIALERI